MPLCRRPCSCNPNDVLERVNDWMAVFYAHWVEAHGVMIVSAVRTS